jgi:hypothetical protein
VIFPTFSFKFLKARRAIPDNGANQARPSDNGGTSEMMAAIMLGDAKMPDVEALGRAVSARLSDVQLTKNGTATLFAVRGAMCAMMQVQSPLPISRQDPCFASAWFWSEAWDVVKNHKAHILVSVNGASNPKTSAAILEQLIAAVCEIAPSPIAVHIANSDGLLPASAIPSAVLPHSTELAIPLFVSVRFDRGATDPSSASAKTKGLSAFGLREIEVLDYTGNPTDLNGTLLDLAGYLIASGAVLKDGDTVGPDDATKITVQHLTSHFDANEQVYRLTFGR